MDDLLLQQLAKSLGEVVTKNTVDIIFDKVKVAKSNKDKDKTIQQMEQIINDLIDDKMEIQRIAQAFNEELVAQKITEKDIKYITTNLIPIIEELIPDEQKDNFSQVKALISVEGITIMQLLGFNYKQAIGIPLTNLVKRSIETKIPNDPNLNNNLMATLAKIALDKDASERYAKITGIEL